MATKAATIGPLVVLDRIPGMRQLIMLIGLALSITVGVMAAFWAQEPSYSMLYSNISDREASEIIDVLTGSDIPHELDRKSGAILVAGDRIHDARLKLAAQGLPRGSEFGLEIIQGESGFSTSQFMENARYHHALETELSRTIVNLRPVQFARVHLALPKSSAFLRHKKKPSASVLVRLFPGRQMEKPQIESIVHLVASSIPEMEASAVTVVDQQGRLLKAPGDDSTMTLSSQQFEYVQRLEDAYTSRIINLLTPMLGPDRIRATVTAKLDFTVREETREEFNPDGTVRSEQFAEDRSTGGNTSGGGTGGVSGGIPGALSNQPPANGDGATQAAAAAPTTNEVVPPVNSSLKRTRNFELDRTISHTQQPTAEIDRLSVAVVVDDNRITDEDGEVTTEPMTTTEIEELTRLVREAVGFNEARGDSLSISNVSFFEPPEAPEPEEPGFLDNPGLLSMLKQLAGAALLLFIGFKVASPIVASLSKGLTDTPTRSGGGLVADGAGGVGVAPPPEPLTFNDKVSVARQLADKNPERVAQIVRQWVDTDE